MTKSKSKGCRTIMEWVGIKYRCGDFEDLKHSDHIILCDKCKIKEKED